MKSFFRKGKRTVKAVKSKIVIYRLIPVKRVTTVQTEVIRVTMDRKQTMPKQRKMKTMKRKRRQS